MISHSQRRSFNEVKVELARMVEGGDLVEAGNSMFADDVARQKESPPASKTPTSATPSGTVTGTGNGQPSEGGEAPDGDVVFPMTVKKEQRKRKNPAEFSESSKRPKSDRQLADGSSPSNRRIKREPEDR
jgi:hypothetical protein